MTAVFIGMETSGALRSRFQMAGFFTISCDTLEAEDGSRYPETLNGVELGGHIQGDVFETLEWLRSNGRWPDLAIFHPTCTYLTNSAEWAYKDPDFIRYPGVGYHQKLKPDTLFGEARRVARGEAVAQAERIRRLQIKRKVIENPIGVLSTRMCKAQQIHQPFQYGDDASKGTCTWYFDEYGEPLTDMIVPLDPAKYVPPTPRENGRAYWANQTGSGQNKLGAGTPNRWKERSRTFPGVADAWVAHWRRFL